MNVNLRLITNMRQCKPIYEFLLWDNCSNNCSFCFQRKVPRILSFEQQSATLDSAIEFITSDQFQKGSHVLVVGGELFDREERQEMLLKFLNQILELQQKDCIDHLYINTNLLYSKRCLETVELFLSQVCMRHLETRLHLTTSYDIAGRFNRPNSEQQFLENLNQLTRDFQNVVPIINTIITRQFCEKTFSGEVDMIKFAAHHKCGLNLIPYIVLDDTLTPTVSQIVKVLTTFRQRYPMEFLRQMSEYDLKEPRHLLYRDLTRNSWISCECELSDCGHSVNFKRYSTHNTCFVCDMKRVFSV